MRNPFERSPNIPKLYFDEETKRFISTGGASLPKSSKVKYGLTAAAIVVPFALLANIKDGSSEKPQDNYFIGGDHPEPLSSIPVEELEMHVKPAEGGPDHLVDFARL